MQERSLRSSSQIPGRGEWFRGKATRSTSSETTPTGCRSGWTTLSIGPRLRAAWEMARLNNILLEMRGTFGMNNCGILSIDFGSVDSDSSSDDIWTGCLLQPIVPSSTQSK